MSHWLPAVTRNDCINMEMKVYSERHQIASNLRDVQQKVSENRAYSQQTIFAPQQLLKCQTLRCLMEVKKAPIISRFTCTCQWGCLAWDWNKRSFSSSFRWLVWVDTGNVFMSAGRICELVRTIRAFDRFFAGTILIVVISDMHCFRLN